jgi:hypothetical protein
MPLPQSGSATCIRPKTAALPLASKSLHAQSKIRAARGISSKLIYLALLPLETATS